MEPFLYNFNLLLEVSSNNNFCVFKSIEDNFYLVYSYNDHIISYNLIDMKIQNKINITILYNKRSPYENHRIIIKHSLDKKNKNDFLLVSTFPGILIFNFNTLECLFSLNIYGYAACLFFDNNKIYCYTHTNFSTDKFIDLKEMKSKEFPSKGTYFCDSYYNDNKGESYLILGKEHSIKSYICCSGNLQFYHEFSEGIEVHPTSALIKKEREITKLFDASYDGYIRIWNFHTGELLSKILIHKNSKILGFDLLDDKYIIYGSTKNILEIFDIETKKFIKRVEGFSFMNPTCIKVINIPNVAQYLISKCNNTKRIRIIKILKKYK